VVKYCFTAQCGKPELKMKSAVDVYRRKQGAATHTIHIFVTYSAPRSHQSSLLLYLRPETRHVLMFDLNEPPHREERETTTGGGDRTCRPISDETLYALVVPRGRKSIVDCDRLGVVL